MSQLVKRAISSRSEMKERIRVRSGVVRRGGFTLLEVMISAMVIMVGLLGVAAMIPAGKFQIMQSMKADMATTYCRSGLRLIQTQDWVNQGTFTSTNVTYFIDPGVNWPSCTSGLGAVPDKDSCDFECSNDRFPREVPGSKFPTYNLSDKGRYCWFATVRVLRNSDAAEVSAGVVFKRARNDDGTIKAPRSSTGRFTNNSAWCTDLTLGNELDIKSEDWVLLTNAQDSHWYKVIGYSPETLALTVSGPAWGGGANVTVVAPGNVVNVQTRIIRKRGD